MFVYSDSNPLENKASIKGSPSKLNSSNSNRPKGVLFAKGAVIICCMGCWGLVLELGLVKPEPLSVPES